MSNPYMSKSYMMVIGSVLAIGAASELSQRVGGSKASTPHWAKMAMIRHEYEAIVGALRGTPMPVTELYRILRQRGFGAMQSRLAVRRLQGAGEVSVIGGVASLT